MKENVLLRIKFTINRFQCGQIVYHLHCIFYKRQCLNNLKLLILSRYVIPSQFQWLEKQSKSNAKNVKSIKFLYPKPNGSRNAIPFMTKNAKRNITSIANKKLDVTTYIKPRATTVAISR